VLCDEYLENEERDGEVKKIYKIIIIKSTCGRQIHIWW